VGWAVSGAGDCNADGYDDFLVGRGNLPVARLASGTQGKDLYAFFQLAVSFGRAVAGAGDINADGYGDVIIGAPLAGTGGNATVYSGNDLFLNANVPAVSAGETLTFTTGVGSPGNLVLLFVIGIDGLPVFLRATPLATFDALGQWILSGPVPNDPALLGHTFDFQAIATGTAGLIDSFKEAVTFQ
jgi:hypothetical protein